MRASKASFKLAISFENWGGLGDRYLHAFGTIGRSTWMGDFQHFWLAAQEEGFGGDLGDYCFERQAALAGKFATSENIKINYAYHFDAGLYAAYLRKLSEPKGVKRIEGKIKTVQQHPETGFVAGAHSRIRRIGDGRPVRRLLRIPRPADRADAQGRVSRTTARGCAPIARSPCRRPRARTSRRTRARSRARRAGSGASRCSIASATASSSAASTRAKTTRAPRC